MKMLLSALVMLALFAAGVFGEMEKTVKKKGRKCDYTLVVQEFDPALCPSIVYQNGGQGGLGGGGGGGGGGGVGDSQTPTLGTPPRSFSSTTPHQVSSNFNTTTWNKNKNKSSQPNPFASQHVDGMVKEQPNPPKRITPSSNRDVSLTNALNEMIQKIQDLEAKLLTTMTLGSELQTARQQQGVRLDHLQTQLRNLDETSLARLNQLDVTMENQGYNLTRVRDDLKDIVLQKTYWKSVDVKLAGLMLDMTETNQAISRHDRLLDQLGSVEKVIPVEASSRVVSCSIAEDAPKYRDCEDLYSNGHTKSGVYYVTALYSPCPIPVYCDMDTPPGGWMVLQRRLDGSVDFNRNWTDYRAGFGSVGHEFWIGLDNIFLLTSQRQYQLRVDLWDFFGSRVHATYGRFHIDGEREGYRMNVSNHSGSVLDGLQHHNGVPFSTPDRDQDTYSEYHCAKEWGAGWWFANCWFVILNGQYYNHTQVEYRGISWNEWKNEQLMKTEMKIRPSSI